MSGVGGDRMELEWKGWGRGRGMQEPGRELRGEGREHCRSIGLSGPNTRKQDIMFPLRCSKSELRQASHRAEGISFVRSVLR